MFESNLIGIIKFNPNLNRNRNENVELISFFYKITIAKIYFTKQSKDR